MADRASDPGEQAPRELPPAIGRPATRALYEAGYTRLEDLTAVSGQELLALHGVGPKAVAILDEALRAHGLAFADPRRI